MTLHELLKPIQDMNVEIHYYTNHINYKQGVACKEILVQLGNSNPVCIKHFEGKIRFEGKKIDWNKCEVFYVGFTSNRSRTLRINVEATEFNE